jgi:hypothetical protein
MRRGLYREWMRRLQLFLAASPAKRPTPNATAGQAQRTA